MTRHNLGPEKNNIKSWSVLWTSSPQVWYNYRGNNSESCVIIFHWSHLCIYSMHLLHSTPCVIFHSYPPIYLCSISWPPTMLTWTSMTMIAITTNISTKLVPIHFCKPERTISTFKQRFYLNGLLGLHFMSR